MVVPSEKDKNQANDINMLEVETATINQPLGVGTALAASRSLPSTNGITLGNPLFGMPSRMSEEVVGIQSTRPSRESVLQRLSEALLRRSLTKIDLSQRGLQPSDAKLVKMALSQNANLSVLKLGYNNLGDAGAITLASGVAMHKALLSLDLGFNNIGDDGCKALATALHESSRSKKPGTLQTLYLAGNLIGQDGALALADSIRHGCSLRKLYMTGNRLGEDGVKTLTEAVTEAELKDGYGDENDEKDDIDNPANDDQQRQQPPLRQQKQQQRATSKRNAGMQDLFLGGTGMGSGGCDAVARLLEKSRCLRVISVPNCDIRDEEVALLASSIKANRKYLPIESIQLSFNEMTHKGLESLMNAIWGSQTLRELKLDNNEIGDKGAQQVAAILPYVKSLKVLDVGFNAIKTSGLNILMKAVAETHHLESLSVSGNAIDVAASKAVAYALAYNRSLKSLFLVHCSILHEGQRHITAGIVSNSRLALRKLTGFDIGPVIVTLGFPTALEHWTNEQVLNFIHLMWDKSNSSWEEAEAERELDPLSFLAGANGDSSPAKSHPIGPLDASVVVEVAKKAYETLVANGVDVFSKRAPHPDEPSFESPLAVDAIMVESPGQNFLNNGIWMSSGGTDTVGPLVGSSSLRHNSLTNQERSFVAAPDTAPKQATPEPARKKRIVEWLCSNIKHLNELSHLPFSSAELWRLHQHYFTPVVNESGGASYAGTENRIVSSVPEVSRGIPASSFVTPLSQSSEEQLTVPVSDPTLPASPQGSNTLPMLKRKVSYRFLGDAMLSTHGRFDSKQNGSIESNMQKGSSVARMIEEGHTGHSLPPKTKKARRNRTRISFVPRIKGKLDSYLDVCHEKALITMRQLYFVEQAILGGLVNPLEPPTSPRTHLCGVQASEAEMIIVDMI